MKYIISLILTFTFAFTQELSFNYRQNTVEQIKAIIQEEESIAKAFEQFILTEKQIPKMSDLKTEAYLTNDVTKFIGFTIGEKKSLSYGLSETLREDTRLKSLYESDTFRKRTFYYNESIYITLKDNFANNLYNLLSNLLSPQTLSTDVNSVCSQTVRYIIKNDHVYICNDSSPYDLIMYYYIHNYEQGPIIVKDDISLFNTKDEFKNIVPGSTIYDYVGRKYLKTNDEIIRVQ